jgi:ABC-type sugar transport system permease subunit
MAKAKTAKTGPKITRPVKLFILFATLLPVLNWLIFYAYANASSFVMAFTGSEGGFSLENFARFIEEFSLPTSDIRIALRNTLLTFGINFVLFIPHVLISYFIYKKIPGAVVYRILFFLPSVLFSVCVAMCFTKMVGVNGFIAKAVKDIMNLEYTPELLADSRFANTVVLTNMIWLGFPGDLIIWGGTFARIPTDVLESAKLDGVSWWQEFTKIIVPLVWPTVALKLVLTICGIFGASGQVYLLTGGHFDTMTISAWQYITLRNGSGSAFTSNVYNYLSAVGLIITVIAVAISLTVRKITDKVFDDVDF